MFAKKRFHSVGSVGKKRSVDKINWRRGSFDVQQNYADLRIVGLRRHDLLCGDLRRNVPRSEAYRLVTKVHAAIGVMRCPAAHVLEQTDGANSLFAAEIEPMQGSLWHANQISLFHFDRHDR